MEILQQIIAHKKKEVAENKSLFPLELLKRSTHYNAPSISLKEYIQRADKNGIIAEFKRKSPSKPSINLYADPEKISISYMQAGASALSVLTDEHFFGGSNNDLTTARNFNLCPILRKDFIIDAYQIHESKSIGADAILLIAEVLTKDKIIEFTKLAHKLNLEVLLELHHEEELEKTIEEVDLIGINNRNLKTFKVDFETSLRLLKKLPSKPLKISESGIQSPEDYAYLRKSGFDGGLIGERFMKESNPGAVCKQFSNIILNS